MSLYDQPNLSGGIDDAIISTAQSVPSFPIMILVFVFFVVLLGGSANQKRKTGNADIPFWSVSASLSTTLLALIMTIGIGIIDIQTLGVVLAITLMTGLWFFLSKTKGEQ